VLQVNNKKEKIEKFREFVNSPVSSGSAFAGLNLCDIYLNVQDREYVLEAIKYRFPTATENIDSAEDWFEKLSSLKSKDSYLNAFVGQAGEYKAIERLEELGKSAKMFESRIHPDNDLIDSDRIEWSVKSYSEDDISNLKSVIAEHPNADHYIINSEAYEKLKTTGTLEKYYENGITFLDGKFNHDDHLQSATERLNAISGSINDEIYDGVWDDVPVVAGIVAVCNISTNISKFYKGKVSEQEATIDVIKSISKLTVAGGGAAAGGAMGASIGSAIFPLAGTVIGGGVGALFGAIGARSLIDDFINNWKFGNTNDAYEHFSNKYSKGLTSEIKEKISKKYYFIDQIKKNLLLEKNRVKKYRNELDLSNNVEPTLSAVIIDETINKLMIAIERIENSANELFDSLIDFCFDCGISRHPRERERSKKYAFDLYGAILAENADWLLTLNDNEKLKINNMKNELSKYPNNAFKLKISKEKLLATIALLTLTSKGNNND
jgi:hypothetical protein